MNIEALLAVVATAMAIITAIFSYGVAPKTGKITDRLLPRLASEVIFIATMLGWAYLTSGNIQALCAAAMTVMLIADFERLISRLVEYRRERFNRDT